MRISARLFYMSSTHLLSIKSLDGVHVVRVFHISPSLSDHLTIIIKKVIIIIIKVIVIIIIIIMSSRHFGSLDCIRSVDGLLSQRSEFLPPTLASSSESHVRVGTCT
jgi:hypothetical protein